MSLICGLVEVRFVSVDVVVFDEVSEVIELVSLLVMEVIDEMVVLMLLMVMIFCVVIRVERLILNVVCYD